MLPNKKILILLLFLVLIHLEACGEDEFVYNPQGKRNPFIPLVTPEGRLLKLDKQWDQSAPGGLAIEGIIYDQHGRSFAIVNSGVVGIGDMVGDFQVLKIMKNKVIFIRDGEPLEIELNKEDKE
jgi:hypothetical protein